MLSELFLKRLSYILDEFWESRGLLVAEGGVCRIRTDDQLSPVLQA